MGKYKKELERIHGKKVRKAKAQVRSFAKGELAYEKLSQRAKKFLAKKKRTEKKPA